MTTVFDFELPKGFVDSQGVVHKRGKMRLATAGDEISATRDPRVLSNPSYLTIVVLAAVITELEGVDAVIPSTVERFFTADLAFLQDMYQRINNVEPPTMRAVCPDCGKVHEIFGESKVQKLAAIYGIDAFIRLPINPDSARLVDEGRVEDIDCDYVAALADTVLR